MTDDPTPPRPLVPATLDPRAIERVIARAGALQAAAPHGGDGLSEQELLDVAREAGLSVEHVRRALAEERLRGALAPDGAPHDASGERGLAVRLAGPGHASASRVVRGRPAAVLERLTRWLERDECMRPVRRLPDGGIWEPRRDLVGNVLRGLRAGGGTPSLRTVAALGGAVVPVDDDCTLVQLDADLSASRRQRLVVGGVTAVTGALAAGSILGLGVVADALIGIVAPLAAFPALAGGGTAWALARGHRTTVARTQLALERVLDQLELASTAEPTRPSTLREVLNGVRRSLG